MSPALTGLTLDFRFQLTAAAGDQRGQAKLRLYEIRETSSARSATPDVKYTFSTPLLLKNHDPATLTASSGLISDLKLRQSGDKSWALYPLTYTHTQLTKIHIMGSESIFSITGFYDSTSLGIIYHFAPQISESWYTAQASNPAATHAQPKLTIQVDLLPYLILKTGSGNALV